MKSCYCRKLCSLSRSQSRIMLHVNSREPTFEHQRLPAARFNIFLKLFDRHATYCYLQVDLKSFLASGAFFFRPRSDRASYDFASNKFQAFQLFDRKSRNQNQLVARLGHLDNIFSVARGQVLRRQTSLRCKLTFPFFADAVAFFCLCNPAL